MKIDNFFSELQRRNVYKVAVAYAVVGWLKRAEREDFYDTDTDFTPWSLED